MINQKIARVIKEEMKARNWTQQKLEDKSGISQPTISRVLNGSNVEVDTLRQLYQALELPFLLDIYDREQLLVIRTTLKTRI